MTSIATHALRACSSLGALCSFKPCTIISQLANLPSLILLQAIIFVFFKFKISSHESLITFFYNSLKNINEHILGLSPFVQGTTLCIFFKWGQTSILWSIKTRSVPVLNICPCFKHKHINKGLSPFYQVRKARSVPLLQEIRFKTGTDLD